MMDEVRLRSCGLGGNNWVVVGKVNKAAWLVLESGTQVWANCVNELCNWTDTSRRQGYAVQKGRDKTRAHKKNIQERLEMEERSGIWDGQRDVRSSAGHGQITPQ
jgi:hypothetical protein